VNKNKPASNNPVDAIYLAAVKGESKTVAEIFGEGRTTEKLEEVAVNAKGFGDAGWQQLGPKTAPKPACKKGCSWCCRLAVAVTAPEVFHLANYIRKAFSAGQIAGLVERLKEGSRLSEEMTPQRRALSGRSCALLADNACSAYEARPLSCRGWNSFDASRCEAATSDAGVRTQGNGFLQTIYSGVFHGIMFGLHDIGYLPTAYDLEAALLTALEQPDAAERWLAGERVFANPKISLYGGAEYRQPGSRIPLL
jgi:hypothetical protein